MSDTAVRRVETPVVGRSRPLLALLGDERLFEQIRRGNHRAFEALYERHHQGLYGFCRHMLSSTHEAEEAVQLTFVAAWDALTAGERPERPKPWLYGIARHRCLTLLRQRREDRGEDEPDEAPTPALAEEIERRSELRDLLSGVSRLPEPQRTALVLFALSGHPQADVAQVIGCDEPRVRALVYQARVSLLEDRRARETPCHEIREKLSVGRGGMLRRRSLRRHLKFCPGCAEFHAELMRERRLLGALAPLVPALALKSQVLTAIRLAPGVSGEAASVGAAKLVTAVLLVTALPLAGGAWEPGIERGSRPAMAAGVSAPMSPALEVPGPRALDRAPFVAPAPRREAPAAPAAAPAGEAATPEVSSPAGTPAPAADAPAPEPGPVAPERSGTAAPSEGPPASKPKASDDRGKPDAAGPPATANGQARGRGRDVSPARVVGKVPVPRGLAKPVAAGPTVAVPEQPADECLHGKGKGKGKKDATEPPSGCVEHPDPASEANAASRRSQ